MSSHLTLEKLSDESKRLGQQINLIQEQNTRIINDIQNSVAREKSDYISKAKEKEQRKKASSLVK